MKILLVLIIFIAGGGLIYLLERLRKKTNVKKANRPSDNPDYTVKIHHLKGNPFERIRKQALDITPQQLGISVIDSEIYGVIMDWDLGSGVMTLVAYKTGDASMYLSTGGGVIGGGQHESVHNAAKSFVYLAQKYIDKAAKVDLTPVPAKDCVRFYFLTSKGKFCAQEQMANFNNGSSFWLDYFNEANKVITELNLKTEIKE